MKKNKKFFEVLPSELISVIYMKLDINDKCSFGQVCKNWRMIHSDFWHDFLASQAPVIVQKTPWAKRACSLYSIIDGKMHNTELPNFSGFSFLGFSSGYMVMVSQDTFMLINPFSRKVMKIPGPTDQCNIKASYNRATLAFVEDSEEFILVAFSTRRLKFKMHVYESRNSNWIINSNIFDYYTWIMDVVVFRKSLYAITAFHEIYVVTLSSPRLIYPQLTGRRPFAGRCYSLKLVSSDDELLVVCFKTPEHLEIHKIDVSTMAWIRLKTLGDRALFSGVSSKCYSMSNPGMWGFDSNCVYSISQTSPTCKVFSMDGQVIRTILIPEHQASLRAKRCNIDWCFRDRLEVVDYSNVRDPDYELTAQLINSTMLDDTFVQE